MTVSVVKGGQKEEGKMGIKVAIRKKADKWEELLNKSFKWVY